jgi:hypothetical protein
MNMLESLASKLLRYDSETGKLFWLPRPREMFSTAHYCAAWNTKFAGKEAFTTADKFGYKQGTLLNRHYLAHRVIWLICTGSWPDGEIDHINGNPSDNRLCNLRVVSGADNLKNQKRPKNNKSGAVGVYWDMRRKKWGSAIQVNGKRKGLGNFSDFETAVSIRKAAEMEQGFHPNHGRVS